MVKLTRIVLTSYILIALLIISIVVTIIVDSPYYSGFEAELSYLSPDLSENRTVIKDSFYIDNRSHVKLIFEKKDCFTEFDRSQFDAFINNLELQIWNDRDYFFFNNKNIAFFNSDLDTVQLPIGELLSSGKYHIYISSDFAVNPTFNIGVGVGRESKFKPIGNNRRSFY